ncbi:transporter substrate-binding domain-containing protein [Mesorhizobium amorphae]|uniref:transporter substrate-binding domain-containing protein n=1 Tax=Mesorhizobium amorphae TaxID=71433 RepID=UPI0017830814|nr:transporter substrate-binding domain-containing protein [Mesorhizobium amorphae]
MLSKISIRIVMSGLALAAILITGTAYAQDEKKTINAGTVTYYPPFEFKDPNTGELMGFDNDLFKAMAKKVGAEANFIEFSWADLASFAPLKTGRVDFYGAGVVGDIPERRANGVSFIDYVYDPYFFFTLSPNADQFKKPDALCGKRVANSRSSTLMITAVNKWSEENCIKAGKPAVVQVGTDNSPEQQLMLKQGRADAGFEGGGSLSYSNKAEGNVYTTIGKPVTKVMLGMAFLNENKVLGEALKKALDELIADGTYVQLLKKWGFPDESSIGQTSSINAGPGEVQ